MKIHRLSSILVLLPALVLPKSLSAQPQRAAADPSRTCSIKGTVVNSVTGEGVPRALVSISGERQMSALTDAEGHVAFEVVEGHVFAIANKPGYQLERRRNISTTLACSIGDSLLLKLEPMGVIKGRITLDDGEPVERTQVWAGHFAIESGRRRWVQVQAAQTDEDGRFRLHDLSPGNYYVSVGPAPLDEVDGLRVALPKLYFPGVSDRNAAGVLALTAGQQVEANMSLKPVNAYQVSGRIATTTPAQRASVQLLDSAGNNLNIQVRQRGDGEFLIPEIPAGSYILQSMVFDQNNPALGMMPLTVSQDISGLQVPLNSQTPIALDFHADLSNTDETGASRISMGPRMMSANALSSATHAYVQLLPLDNTRNISSMTPEGPPEKRSWILKNVQPGKYLAQVMSQGLSYVESAHWSSLNLLAEPMTVTVGGSPDPIEINLRDDGATLSGTVTGSAESVTVLAFARGRMIPFTGGAYLQNNNLKFMFPMLPPGDYTVYAFDSVENLEYMNPKVLEKYSSSAAHVTLSQKQKSELQLTVIEVEK
jgi:hypothetical protein